MCENPNWENEYAAAAAQGAGSGRRRFRSRQFAASAALQNEKSDRAGQVCIALGVDRGHQGTDAELPPCGNLAERVPESRLDRNARRMPGDPHRAFDDLSALGHCPTMARLGCFSSLCPALLSHSDTQLETEWAIRKDPAADRGSCGGPNACNSPASATIKPRRGPATLLFGKVIYRALRGRGMVWGRPQLWIHH